MPQQVVTRERGSVSARRVVTGRGRGRTAAGARWEREPRPGVCERFIVLVDDDVAHLVEPDPLGGEPAANAVDQVMTELDVVEHLHDFVGGGANRGAALLDQTGEVLAQAAARHGSVGML